MKGWELMRIRGIPIRIHSSWLVIFFLFSWTAQGQVSNLSDLELPVWVSWFIGCLTSLLLFVSVLLHELGHSFVALSEGVKVRCITLFFLGGVAQVDKECTTPMGSFRVALAGPLVSFLLSIIFLKSVVIFSVENPIYLNILTQLGSLNLVLCLFNLLPGLPLDGGVILKSLVWHFSGSKRKGIKVATSSGRFISCLAIFIGCWVCFRGGGLGGLWLIVLGWFGFSSSRSQNQTLLIQEALCNLKVNNVDGRRFRVLENNLPIQAINQLRITSKNDDFPEWILVCDTGRWIGYVNDEPLKEVPIQDWSKYFIGDYSKPLSELPSISEKAPLWQAVLALEKTDRGRLLVLSLAGLPKGTLDKVDIGIAVLRQIGLNLPSKFIQLSRKQNSYPLGLALPQLVDGMIASGLIEK